MINKPVIFFKEFMSKSNPSKPPHKAQVYMDLSTSCNCAGWCKHVDKDTGLRSCTHTRELERDYVPALKAGGLGAAPVTQSPVQSAPVQTVTRQPGVFQVPGVFKPRVLSVSW